MLSRTVPFTSAAMLLASAAFAGIPSPVPTAIEVAEGDVFGSRTVEGVNVPRLNGQGVFATILNFDDSSRGLYEDGAITFNSADDPADLSGAESAFGFGNDGAFIYSPRFEGEDSVFGRDAGESPALILVENTPAPGFPATINSTFHSRPYMTDDGTAYWVSGFNDGMGGTSSQGRMLYKRDTSGTITILFQAGMMISGEEIGAGSGVDFDYHASTDSSRFINTLTLANGNAALVVDGSLLFQEGEPIDLMGAELWDNFDNVAISNSGNYIFSGNTDTDSDFDEFLAYNGEILLREGDTIAGGTLTGSLDGLMLTDNESAAFVWETNDEETLIYLSDVTDTSSAIQLLRATDQIDTDEDGTADFVVTDFNATSLSSGTNIALRDTGNLYVEVDLEPVGGGDEFEAILSFQIDRGNDCAPDFNSDGEVNTLDYFDFLAEFFAGSDAADYNDDDETNTLDYFDFLTDFFNPPMGC